MLANECDAGTSRKRFVVRGRRRRRKRGNGQMAACQTLAMLPTRLVRAHSDAQQQTRPAKASG